MANLVRLLDRAISYHRCFAAISGSVTAGVLLSQCIFWANRTRDPDGWFYKTQDEWFEETYLSRKEQESARARLRRIGVLEEKRQGVPCQLFYRINFARLNELLEEYAPPNDGASKSEQNGQPSMSETGRLECPKGAFFLYT